MAQHRDMETQLASPNGLISDSKVMGGTTRSRRSVRARCGNCDGWRTKYYSQSKRFYCEAEHLRHAVRKCLNYCSTSMPRESYRQLEASLQLDVRFMSEHGAQEVGEDGVALDQLQVLLGEIASLKEAVAALEGDNEQLEEELKAAGKDRDRPARVIGRAAAGGAKQTTQTSVECQTDVVGAQGFALGGDSDDGETQQDGPKSRRAQEAARQELESKARQADSEKQHLEKQLQDAQKALSAAQLQTAREAARGRELQQRLDEQQRAAGVMRTQLATSQQQVERLDAAAAGQTQRPDTNDNTTSPMSQSIQASVELDAGPSTTSRTSRRSVRSPQVSVSEFPDVLNEEDPESSEDSDGSQLASLAGGDSRMSRKSSLKKTAFRGSFAEFASLEVERRRSRLAAKTMTGAPVDQELIDKAKHKAVQVSAWEVDAAAEVGGLAISGHLDADAPQRRHTINVMQKMQKAKSLAKLQAALGGDEVARARSSPDLESQGGACCGSKRAGRGIAVLPDGCPTGDLGKTGQKTTVASRPSSRASNKRWSSAKSKMSIWGSLQSGPSLVGGSAQWSMSTADPSSSPFDARQHPACVESPGRNPAAGRRLLPACQQRASTAPGGSRSRRDDRRDEAEPYLLQVWEAHPTRHRQPSGRELVRLGALSPRPEEELSSVQ